MTRFLNFEQGCNFIVANWKVPSIHPSQYQISALCSNSSDASSIYFNETFTLHSDVHSIKVTSLNPGINCDFKLFAVYNPISLDPGIQKSSRTLNPSKFSLRQTGICCEKCVAITKCVIVRVPF